MRTKDYERYLVARHREAEEAERAAQQAAEKAASPADDGPAEPSTADGAAAEAVVNGVAVPAFLLERSRRGPGPTRRLSSPAHGATAATPRRQ